MKGGGMPDGLIDAFGASEFFVTGVHREMICSELIRLTYYATEDGQKIVKARVIITMQDFLREQRAMMHFIGAIRVNASLM